MEVNEESRLQELAPTRLCRRRPAMRSSSSHFGIMTLLVFVVACGSAPPRVEGETRVTEADSTHEAEAVNTGEPPPEDDTPTEDTPTEDTPTGCAGRAHAQCLREDGCVWSGACRDPADVCELVTPNPSWNGEPVFSDGDPCENVRSDCAWSTTLRRCVPFVAVLACPATLSETQATQVACDHSGQPELACAYGPTRCSCVRSHYCGGAAPPPTLAAPPGVFTCVPPVDERGCPTSAIRAGARCEVSEDVECAGCTTSARCVRGRWRVLQLPPRP